MNGTDQSAEAPGRGAARPNIVWILSDQHRAEAIGANSDGVVQTPNLDALMAEATSFDSSYCQGPLCVPARASLLTQRYVSDHGVEDNTWRNGTPGLPTTVQQIRNAGYHTAALGKMHLYKYPPDVADGGIADSRAKMDAVLAANPEPGSISAVWAAWDQPALGALQAIEAAGRQGEGIVITGIDANPQAREEVAKGGNFEATVAQDFAGIGTATAEAVAGLLEGNAPASNVIYVPTKLITKDNAAQ